MNIKRVAKIIHDREVSGMSYRNLALKHGISTSSAFRMVNKNKPNKITEVRQEEDLPDDVAALKALLRRERLKNELLNNIIDIADKELGTNIRKKSGTRQSE